MKHKYLFVFCLALILRAGLALVLFGYFGDIAFNTKDGNAHYLPLAKNLATGNGFTLDGVNTYAYKAPGYPLFLAFFYKIFGVFWPAIVAQIILSALLSVLIFKIGEKVGFGKKISFIAGVLTATAPHLIYYGNFFVTEALFAFLLLFGILYFIKFLKRPSVALAVLSGLFLGLDTLVKTSGQYLVFVFLAVGFLYFWKSKENSGFKKYAVFLSVFFCVFILAVLPLAVRNYFESGSFSLNSQGAYLLYRYEGASIVVVRDKVSFGDAERIAKKELLVGTGLENLPEEKLTDLKYSSVLLDRTLGLMGDNLGAVFKVGLANVFAFWTHSNYAYFLVSYKIISMPAGGFPVTYALASGDLTKVLEIAKSVLKEPYYLVAFVSRVFWVLAALFAAVAFIYGVFKKEIGFQKRMFVLFLFLVIFYYNFTSMVLGFGVEGRLRYNVEPIMYLLAVFGLYTACRFLRFCKKVEKTCCE
ncbi:MAG: glycosyltransferase family 39 protein [bacterium]|nr:glycosyltransferase family 39 protein [bacterium]